MMALRQSPCVYLLLLITTCGGTWSPVCIKDTEDGCSKTDEDGNVVITCEYESVNNICSEEDYEPKDIYPVKPQQVRVDTYLADYSGAKYPGFNVTWEFDAITAPYLKGFQVYMVGLSVGSDFGKQRCHTFDLSQTNFTQDMFTNNPSLSFFYDDCLRSLNPGDQYQIVVRSLPYDPIIGNEVWAIYTIPDCTYESMKDSWHCLQRTDQNNPLLWMPSHLLLYPGYSSVNVSFQLAPDSEEYGFNEYHVGLYQCPNPTMVEDCSPSGQPISLYPFGVDSDKIYNTTVNNIPVQSMIYTVLYEIPVDVAYHVGITPWPDPNTCFTTGGNPTTCITSISPEFIALGKVSTGQNPHN